MRSIILCLPFAFAGAFACFSVFTLPSCLPDDGTDGGGTSSSSGGTTDGGAEASVVSIDNQACLDEADAYAAAAVRCGGDSATYKATFITEVAGGDCNKVTIRDVTELRSMCIPSFSTISCDDLTNNRFAPGCAEQIQAK